MLEAPFGKTGKFKVRLLPSADDATTKTAAVVAPTTTTLTLHYKAYLFAHEKRKIIQ